MMPSVFWEYVLSPTRSGVLAAIDAAQRSATANSNTKSSSTVASAADARQNGIFSTLSAEQREALRQYIASVEPVRALSGGKNIYSLLFKFMYFYSYFSFT